MKYGGKEKGAHEGELLSLKCKRIKRAPSDCLAWGFWLPRL